MRTGFVFNLVHQETTQEPLDLIFSNNVKDQERLSSLSLCSKYSAGPIRSQPKNDLDAKYFLIWCLETELNRRHSDFQSDALPTELSRQNTVFSYITKTGANSVCNSIMPYSLALGSPGVTENR